jgi:hypothetical protein
LQPAITYPADFPAALFTANAGLALKSDRVTQTAKKDADGYCDINVNPFLARKHAAGVSKPQPRYRYLPWLIGVAVLLVFPLVLIRIQQITKTAQLQTQVDRTERALRIARLVADENVNKEAAIQQLLAEIDNLTAQRQEVLGMGLPVSEGLQYIQNTAVAPTIIASIDITTEQVILEGEAVDRDGVIAYALALENLRVFKEVRVASLGDVTTENTVPFEIVLTR